MLQKCTLCVTMQSFVKAETRHFFPFLLECKIFALIAHATHCICLFSCKFYQKKLTNACDWASSSDIASIFISFFTCSGHRSNHCGISAHCRWSGFWFDLLLFLLLAFVANPTFKGAVSFLHDHRDVIESFSFPVMCKLARSHEIKGVLSMRLGNFIEQGLGSIFSMSLDTLFFRNLVY